MPIAEDSAGGSPVPIPTNLTTNLTGEATGSGTLDYTTGDIDIAVTVVDNGHNHILSNITDVQVNNAISGQILVYNGTVWANATNTSGITAIVQDLTPQLGGNLDLNNRNITGTGNIAITGTIDGRDVSADGTKLDGIESGATADQTAAQIKTAYESNANTNNFADADVSKLSGIEPGATADQTAAQIKTAYESNADTNAFTDADHTKLDGIETSADVTDTTNVVASLTAGTNVTISAGGVISSTASGGLAHVVDDTTPQLGGNLDLNSNDITGTGNLNFTGNVTLSGTVDGRDVASDGTKLDGIEASADVTDTANVTAAGALMDSEVTNLAQVKAFDSSDYATAAQGTTADAALPKAGGTMTGDILFNDSIKAKFGTSSDLQIWHNGTDSYVYDTGAGDLILRGSSNIKLQSAAGTALSTFTAAGASTLYYSAAEKLATTSTGIDVTGKAGINVASPSAYLHIKDDTAANDDYDVQIESFRPNLVFEDISGSATDYQIFVDSNTMKFLYGDASTNTKLANEVLEINTTGIGVTGKIGVGDAGTIADHELHIQSASPTIRLEDTDGNKRFDITQSGNDTNFDYETNMLFKKSDGTEIFRIDTAGIDVTGDIDVANGTTYTSTGDFLAKVQQNSNATGKNGLSVMNAWASSTSTIFEAAMGWNGSSAGYYPVFTIDGLGKTTWQDNAGNVRATIDGSGLDVTGAIDVTGASNTRQWSVGTAGAKMGIYALDNSTMYMRVESGTSSNLQFGTYDNIPIYTITDNTVRTTLLGNGNFGVGHTSPVAKMAILGSSNSTITEANSNLCVEGSGGNGLLFGTLNTTGFKSYIQSGFVANLGTATYDLLLNPEGGNVGVGLTTPTAKMHLFTDGIDQSIFSAQTDLGTNNRILTLKSPVSDSSSAPYRWQTSNSIQWEIDSTESKSMILNSAGLLGIGTYSPNHEIHIESTSPTIRLVDTDNNNTVDFTQSGSATYIDFDNNVRFRNLANVERLRIDSNGIDVTGDLTVSSTIEVGSLTPNQDGAIEVGVIALGTPAISSTTDSTSLRNHIIFDNPNGAVGKINTLNSATSYLTSSDYRLKTDVQEMTGSIDRVKALRPVNFEWVVDGTRVDGFLAHEASSVVPESVHGEKDAMRDKVTVITPLVEATYDEEGNELTPEIPAVTETEQVPDYQGIDQSKLVPLLTSALQDAIVKIEALETRLEALES